MARLFWIVFSISVIALLALFAGIWAGKEAAESLVPFPLPPVSPTLTGLPIAIAVIYATGRLAVRATRTEAAPGLVAMVFVASALPVAWPALGPPRTAIAISLAVFAVNEVLTVGLAPRRALLAGALFGLATLLEASLLPVVVLAAPFAVAPARFQRYRVGFLVIAFVPVLASYVAWGGAHAPHLSQSNTPLAHRFHAWRVLWDTYFFGAWLPFVVTAIVAATRSRSTVDRRAVAVLACLAVGGLATLLLGVATATAYPVYYGLVLILIAALAAIGLVELVRVGRNVAPRPWAALLIALFLTPPALGCLRLAARLLRNIG